MQVVAAPPGRSRKIAVTNRTLIGMGLVITMLSGCAVGPDFRPPEASADVTGYIGRGDNADRVDTARGHLRSAASLVGTVPFEATLAG